MLEEIANQLASTHPDVEVIWNIWPLSMFVWTIFRFPLNVLFALFYIPFAWTWYLWNFFWQSLTVFLGFPVVNNLYQFFIFWPVNLFAFFTTLIPFVNLLTWGLAAVVWLGWFFIIFAEGQSITLPYWGVVIGVPATIGGIVGAVTSTSSSSSS